MPHHVRALARRAPLVAAALALLACSKSRESISPNDRDGGAGNGGSGAGNGGSGMGNGGSGMGNGGSGMGNGGSGAGNGGTGGFTLPPSPDGGVSAVPPGCVNYAMEGEKLPIDLYLMMDSSTSMLQKLDSGDTKWDAVRAALRAFFADPKSAGIGVGLQFFPKIVAGAPKACTSESECGMFTPCLGIRTCAGQGYIDICATDADCGGKSCIPFGYCASIKEFCSPLGMSCAGGADTCQGPVEGYCLGRDSCTAADYASPAVAVAPLPGAADALTTSLMNQMPDGYTPTSAALGGALDYARARARANPDRRVAVVLATDGLPTSCAPKDIGGVAALARKAYGETPSIATFVIGVFAPNEQSAAGNLNQLAQAGGPSAAHIVNTSQNVTQSFLAALNAIRATAVGCEFKMPSSTAQGMKINYANVNVRFTASSGQQTTIPQVADKSKCDANLGGWYYDISPNTGTPTKILTCEKTCALLGSDPRGKVEILVGCRTIVIP
jgi:hypothetical protein